MTWGGSTNGPGARQYLRLLMGRVQEAVAIGELMRRRTRTQFEYFAVFTEVVAQTRIKSGGDEFLENVSHGRSSAYI